MPILNPIAGAATNSNEIISAALASFEIARTRELFACSASLETREEYNRPSLATLIARIIATRSSYGSIDAGTVQLTDAASSIDAGAVQLETSAGALETNIEVQSAARLTLDVGDSGTAGVSQLKAWASLMGLVVGGDAKGASLASAEVSDARLDAALGSIQQTQEGKRAALASLATSKTIISAGLCGLDAGEVQSREALASLEVEAAEGIDVIIDITDTIVATAKGDVC